jgi:hypothetical protein
MSLGVGSRVAISLGMAKLHRSLGLGGLLGCLLGSWACSSDNANPVPPGGSDQPVDVETQVPGDGVSEFVSSTGSNASDQGVSRETASAGDGTLAPAANDNNPGAADLDTPSVERAISEADILQLSGDRLYALSRYSGLTVIDVSNPAALRPLGVYRSAAEPFEMYVEDGLVYAMFNGWYSYACDASGFCSWQTESRVQAVDARDPANMQVLADLEVPGNIVDSRRVGDVMYLATEQWGGCWGCESDANTTLTSFDVSELGRFTQIDQLRLPAASEYGGSRSIAVTDRRIYIGGYDYDRNYNVQPGSVQVVDISDPSGALVEGARFNIAGPIQSRWQMDEYDGVFRAISQPGGWGTEQPPLVETFRVNASDDIQRAGSLTVQLPRSREVLQSVRFDGTRAYAITAEQRDPLFTFDLSNPATPRQMGELEMPGWVYHMEPRGDRLYALGNDPNNPDGSLHVSLFDVSNLAQPTLLSRVAFGGDWGSFAEGQNQIHKAFSILPELGLILVPFSGGKYDEATCDYDYGSGIQLVDFTDTTLTRRGVAPQVGNARRALLHREHLFGIGDNAVQTFDISNRDAPVATGQLDVARNVTTVRVLGDHLLRFGSDWATNQTILDMTPLAQASSAEPQAEIDLSALFGQDEWSCNGGSSWSGQVFTRGDYAYVPRYSYDYDPQKGTSQQALTFFVVDVSDRAAPRAVGSFDVEPTTGDTYITNVLQTDNTLLVGRSQGYYSYNPATGKADSSPRYFYDVIELSNPSAPTVASRFEVPAQIAAYGWGRFGVMGCSLDMGWGWYGGGGDAALTDGDTVVSQHSEPVTNQPGQVKYFLDRIDVSDPFHPNMLSGINIPGTAIHYNGDTNELITLDYQETLEAAATGEDCYARGYYGYYDGSPQRCRVTRRSINALVLQGDRAVRTSQLFLDRSRRAGNIAVSDDRIFYTTSDFPVYGPYAGGPVPSRSGSDPAPVPVEMSPVTLETLRLDGGELTRLPSQELRQLPRNGYYYGELYARDERVFEIFDSTVTVVDTLDPTAPTRISQELPGWGCASLEVADDAAYCAVGQRGVEVIDLSSMR